MAMKKGAECIAEIEKERANITVDALEVVSRIFGRPNYGCQYIIGPNPNGRIGQVGIWEIRGDRNPE